MNMNGLFARAKAGAVKAAQVVSGTAVGFASGGGGSGGGVQGAEADALVQGLVDLIAMAGDVEEREQALEELRDACAEEGAEDATAAVGACGLEALSGVLAEAVRKSDNFTVVGTRYALETLTSVFAGCGAVERALRRASDFQSEETDDSRVAYGVRLNGANALANTRAWAGSVEEVGRVLGVLGAVEDDAVRFHALQLVGAVHGAYGREAEGALLGTPMAVVGLMDCIGRGGGGEGRSGASVDDAVRNEALKTLTCLTRDSQDVQQIAAFEGAFDRLFTIVLEERDGIGGGAVVQDCLGFLRNLLRGNVATQGLFVESGGVGKLEKLLRLRASDFDFMTRQKQGNLAGTVALCSALCWDERDGAEPGKGSPSSSSQVASANKDKEVLARRQGRQALLDSGCFTALLPIALSRIPAPSARCGALHCVAAMLDVEACKAAFEAASVRLDEPPAAYVGDEPGNEAEAAQRRRGQKAVEANAVARTCRVAVFSGDGDESAAACRVLASWCRGRVESQLLLAATLVPRPSAENGEAVVVVSRPERDGHQGAVGGLVGGKPSGRAYDDSEDTSVSGVGPMVLTALAECDASTGEGVLRARAAATVVESIIRNNVAAKELALRAVPEMAGVAGPAGRAGLLPLVVACLSDTSRRSVTGDLGTQRQGGLAKKKSNLGVDCALCSVALGRLLLTWLYDCPSAVAAFVEEGDHLPLLLDTVVVRPSAAAMSLAEAERATQIERRRQVQEGKKRWSRVAGGSMSDLSLLMGKNDFVGEGVDDGGPVLWDGTVSDPPVLPLLGATDAKQQLAGLCALLLGCCIMYNDCMEVSRRVVLDLVCSRVGLHGFAQAWAGLEGSHAVSHPRDAQDGWYLYDARFGDWAGRFMAEVNAQIERMYAGGQGKGGGPKALEVPEVDVASLSPDDIRGLVAKNRELTHQLLNVAPAIDQGKGVSTGAPAASLSGGAGAGEVVDKLRNEVSSLRAELAKSRNESEAAHAEATRASEDLVSLSEAYNAMDESHRALVAQVDHLRRGDADRKSEADRRASESSKLAEGRAEAADARASEAEGRAAEAEGRARGAESRAAEAESRADIAESQLNDAKARLMDAETRLTDAERRAANAETHLADAKRQAADAETRLADAERRATSTESRFGDAENRVGDAEGRARLAEDRCREVEDRCRVAEDHAHEVEISAKEAQGRATLAEGRIKGLEERISQLELELSEAVSRSEDVEEARKVAESDLEDLLEVVGEQEKLNEVVRTRLATLGMDVDSIFNVESPMPAR